MLIYRRLRHWDQRGYTLIEMLAVLALIGLIAGGIAMTISQVLTVNTRTSNRMVALRQVQQAGDRLSKDVLQSLPPQLGGEIGNFPITLLIPYYADDGSGGTFETYKVTYELVGDRLQREYYSDPSNSAPDYITTVAQHIVRVDPITGVIKTSFAPAEGNGAYVFEVTAAVGEQTETRKYEIEPRPTGS